MKIRPQKRKHRCLEPIRACLGKITAAGRNYGRIWKSQVSLEHREKQLLFRYQELFVGI